MPNVARFYAQCRRLYFIGMTITTCIDCAETLCKDCLIPYTVSCPHCGAAASESVSHFAVADVQGVIPVVGGAFVDDLDDVHPVPVGVMLWRMSMVLSPLVVLLGLCMIKCLSRFCRLLA